MAGFYRTDSAGGIIAAAEILYRAERADMKRRMLPAVVVLAALPAWAESPIGPAPVATGAGQAAAAPAAAPATDVDPGAGTLFRSRSAGLEITPPAGGQLIRRPNDGSGGDIVQFVYGGQRVWNLHVKLIPNGTGRPLLTKAADPADPAKPVEPGLLDLAVAELTKKQETEPTTVSLQQAVTIGATQVGLIEARRGTSINQVFLQEALFPDADGKRYVLVQMVSPGRPRGADPAADKAAGDTPEEAQARRVFRSTLGTVRLLNVAEIQAEANQRGKAAEAFLAGLTEDRVKRALPERRFIRVVRNNENVGFVQIDTRLATREKTHSGFEVVVQSHVESPGKPADGAVAAVPGSRFDARTVYFDTFDRWHEAWDTTSQLTPVAAAGTLVMVKDASGKDVPVGPVVVDESGSSDQRHYRALDKQKQFALARQVGAAGKPANGNPPMIEWDETWLRASRSTGTAKGKGVGPLRMLPIYLPQAVGQVLPELLPQQPGEYLFQWYVSEQGDTLGRYVDVRPAADVVIDGQRVNGAVPIEDRIGIDSPPTIHYVKDGQWLGDVVDDGAVMYLPTTAAELKTAWGDRFHVYAIDPVTVAAAPVGKPPAARAGDAAPRPVHRYGPDVPGLDTAPIQPNGGGGR